MNRPLLSCSSQLAAHPPVDVLAAAIAAELITDLEQRLAYADLRLKVALESADQAHAKLAEHLRLVPFVDPEPVAAAAEPEPPIWHAIRQAPKQRVGLLVW